MIKRESNEPWLMAGIALLLLALGFSAYEIMNYKFYNGGGDLWKEFWLPAITSIVAALVTFIAAFIFLRRGRTNEQIDLAEQVSEMVLEKLKAQLATHTSSIKNESQLEAFVMIAQKLAATPSNDQNISPSETIKEGVNPRRRLKTPSINS